MMQCMFPYLECLHVETRQAFIRMDVRTCFPYTKKQHFAEVFEDG